LKTQTARAARDECDSTREVEEACELAHELRLPKSWPRSATSVRSLGAGHGRFSPAVSAPLLASAAERSLVRRIGDPSAAKPK
jgi:hypothetical protein